MAALKIGKREKIVVGAILGLGCILALHVFIFSKRIKEYTDLRNNYQQLKTEYGNMGNIQNPKEIQTYKTQTGEYITEFNKTIDDLNLDFPPHHQNPEDPESEKKIYQETYDFVKMLRQMAESTEGIKYSFLGTTGWNFPTKLPEPIVAKRVNVGDTLDKIRDVQEILKVISADNYTILNQKQADLKNLKKEIGVDTDIINQIKKYGEDVPRYVLLAHVDLIMEAKPEDYALTREQLYTYLDIQMQKYVMALTKQIEGSVDILDRAKKAGIEDIKELYYLPENKIMANKTTGETTGEFAIPKAKPGAAPGAVSAPGMTGEMMAGEPGMPGFGEPGMPGMGEPGLGGGEMGMVPGMEEMAGEPGMPGMGTLAQKQQGQQAKQQGTFDTLVAIARPIRITVAGPNLNVMNFLYDISHCKKTYELDDLLFKSTQEGKVECTMTVTILTWIDKMLPITVAENKPAAPQGQPAVPAAPGAPPAMPGEPGL